MSFRLDAHTPNLDAAPGEIVLGRVEIHNDGRTSTTYRVEVVGLDGGAVSDAEELPPSQVTIDAGQSAIVDVPVVVPATLGIGQHATAFEATSSHPDERAVLTPFTLSIASVSRVDLEPVPSTIRARRRAKFDLDVTNREPQPVDVTITGEAPDVEVRFVPSVFTLQPGQRAVAKGSVRGPRRWAGENTQHNLVITARGRASSTNVTAAYVQRPLFAHRLRMVLAAFTVVALWLAAIGGVAFWLATRDDGSNATSAAIVGVDTDGDGIVDIFRDADGNPVAATDADGDDIPDTFVDGDGTPIAGTDTDNDGIPDTIVNTDGDPVEAVDTNGDGIPDALSDGSTSLSGDTPTAAEPKSTVLRGTVQVDGDPSSVAVTLVPIALGAAPDPEAAPIGFRGTEPAEATAKLWPARHGVMPGATTRRTLAIEPDATQPGVDGVWLFSDVLQGQSYEISFAKPGFDTQAFVVTPAEDGEPIDLEVEMTPAVGALSGTVSGPSGVLGGAEITITDGTLTFQTTSDSETGAWSIEGVSTPGIYTMSAVLRGYATAVRQVELAPGEEASGITLPMSPGLGTITGRVVDSSGQSLGGVAITASNGDTVLTSTTLTEGDIGFFSLPQLDVPATYTVSAELDGFVTQTRRVPLNGSVGGVDFTMASETITLTGRVMSAEGGGVESAGLTISTGDLTFRTSTSAAPVAGVFEIDRLPPGTYTITVEHYEHESATEFLTIEPGTTPPPLNITLDKAVGPPDVGRGSLVVRVVNNDPVGDPIEDALVTINRNRTGEPAITKPGGDALGVTFDNLRIGTYTVTATKDGFNTSQPVLVSVGLTRQETEVRLQELGSASGTIVEIDPDTSEHVNLDGYEIVVERLDGNGDLSGNQYGPFQPGPAPDYRWATANNRLPTGRYQILVRTPPSGFLVRTNQTPVIEPAELALPNMQFEIPRVSEQATPSLDITLTASPYPNIVGNVYKPTLDGTTVEYAPLEAPLNVTAVCNGASIDDVIIDSVAQGPAADRFTISREQLAEAVAPADLPTTCQLSVRSDGREPAQVTIDNVDAGNGAIVSDRKVAVALVSTPAPLTGTAFWLDEGQEPDARVPLAATISSTAEAISAFNPSVSAPGGPAPMPVYETAPVATTSSDVDGSWTLTGQAFGTTTYNFVAPEFGVGSVPFTIDEDGLRNPSGNHPGAVVDLDGTRIDVELRPPELGIAAGVVTMNTSSTVKYAPDMVVATDASGAQHTTTPQAGGNFQFVDAVPGRWSIDFVTPPNHRRDPPVGPVVQVVQPGSTVPTTGFDATFTELATVDITLYDRVTGAPITPEAGFELRGAGASPTRTVGPADTDGGYELSGVPVAAADPVTNAVVYDLELKVEGYDIARARIGNQSAPATDLRDYTIQVVAGQVVSLDVYLAPYYSIESSLIGRTGGADEALRLDDAAPNPATLAVEPVDASGASRATSDPAPTVTGQVDGSFSITGAPGFYRVAPSHPEYVLATAPTASSPAAPTSRIYEILDTADTTLDPFYFDLRTGTLDITAVETLASNVPVDDVTYDLFRGSSCSGSPIATNTFDGTQQLPGLTPGTYCLELNTFTDPLDPAKRTAFPAVVTVDIPRSTATVEGTATVVAPLPSLRATVIGRLVAVNALTPDPDDVDLVATEAPVVTSTWGSPNVVSVDGTLVPNSEPANDPIPGNKSDAATQVTPADDGPVYWEYSFSQVPYGSHQVTAPVIPGYTLKTSPNPQTMTVDAMGPTDGPTFVYELATTDLEIALGADDFPSLDGDLDNLESPVVLTSPTDVSYTSYSLDITDPANKVLVFEDVAPEKKKFRLQFDDRLHSPVDAEFNVPTNPNSGELRRVSVSTTADKVRLTGTAKLQSAAGTEISLTPGTTITLGSTQLVAPAPVPDPDDGSPVLIGDTYIFDVAPATYTLGMTQSEYVPLPSTSVTLGPAGTIGPARNLLIDRLAKIIVETTSGGLPDPPGFKVELVRSDGAVYSTPCSTAANTCHSSTPANLGADPPVPSGTYEFRVPSGTYSARASGTNYPNQLSTSRMFAVGEGWSAPAKLTIELARVATVNVTGPGSSANPTVTLGTATSASGATSPFVFTDVTDGIASTGILTGEASATGFRPQPVTIAAGINSSTTVNLQPEVTVSGTIAGAPPSTGVIKATHSDSTVRTGTIVDDEGVRRYTISGLGIGSWTVSYDVTGVGAASEALPAITATSANELTQNLDLTVRQVDHTFSVTQTSGELGGATVTISDGTGTIDSDTTDATDGEVTLQSPENRAPTTWTVTDTGFLTRTGSMSSVPNPILLSPAVSGSVTNAGATAVNATVTICPSASTTPCASPSATFSPTPGGTYKFNGPLANGSYRIWAVVGTGQTAKSASIPLTVGAGTSTTTPATGLIAIP